ncbi:hypothetical protein N9X60_03040 [Paracoccaceae bacterium]|nr:hypothetical protein [Paracoccaceae bacterium]
MENNKKFFVDLFYDESLIRGYDLVFLLGVTHLIDTQIKSFNGLVCVVHESDLPKGRGFAPLQWQVLERKTQLKVSLIELAAEADTGDIILQTDILFDGTELYDELRDKQAIATYELMSAAIDKYPNLGKEPQKGSASFYPRRLPRDSELDPSQTLIDLFPKLQVANNEHWPAFFFFDGKKFILKIYKE